MLHLLLVFSGHFGSKKSECFFQQYMISIIFKSIQIKEILGKSKIVECGKFFKLATYEPLKNKSCCVSDSCTRSKF